MAAGSVIGALRVNLGLDSANFETGAKKVKKETAGIKTGLSSFAKSMAGPIAAMVSLSAVMATVGRGADDIDKAAKSARRLGSSIGGFRALELAAGEAGVSVESLADAVQTMDREIAKGSKGAIDALGQLGLTSKELAGLDVDKKIALIGDRIKAMGLSTGQASALLQGLGIRSKEFLLAVQDGGGALRSARTDIEDYGLVISQLDSDGIEVANDAIGRLTLIGQYLAQQFSLAVTPALGRFAEAMTDSLREGGLLRFAIDAIVLAIRAVVGVVNLAVDGFNMLITAMDMPERALRWLFGLGPTAMQARQAIDQLTLAMGDELRQLVLLTGEMANGKIMTKEMATAKLEQARAHLATIDAMRAEQAEIIKSSTAWADYQSQLDTMQGRLAGIAQEQNAFAYDRGEIDDYLEKIQAVRDKQAELLGDAASLSPEYQAAVAEIARIESAIASSTGEMVTFNGKIITAADITARLAGAANGISFASATNSAAALARQLGISLGLAQALARAGAGRGDGGTVVFDPRDPRYNAEAAKKARIAVGMAELNASAGTVSPFDPSRIPKVDLSGSGAAAAKGGSGGGGGGGAKAANEAADAVEKLKEKYSDLQATIGMTEQQQRIYTETQALGKLATQGQKDEVARLIPLMDAIKDRTNAVKEAMDTMREGMKTAFTGLVTGAKSLKAAIGDLLGKFADMLANQAFDAIWGGMSGGIGGGKSGGGFGGLIGKILGFANGTNYAPGGMALVGERGPELVNLPRGSRVNTAQQTKSMMGGGGTMSINVNVSGARGNAEIEQMVASGVRQGISGYDRQMLPARVAQINADRRRIG